MTFLETNPFNKPNPFKILSLNSNEPSGRNRIYSNAQPLTSHAYYDQDNFQMNKPPNNFWNFHENNLVKVKDFTKRQHSTNQSKVNFQTKMRASNISYGFNQNSRVNQHAESKFENPFYRKNLLIDRQEMVNQLELEISNFKNKEKSLYVESKPYRQSINTPIYKDFKNSGRGSQATVEYRKSFEGEEEHRRSNSRQKELSNSEYFDPKIVTFNDNTKTGEISKKVSIKSIENAEKQQESSQPSKSIKVRGKTYFLNDIQLI